jgi:hypothetical protein
MKAYTAFFASIFHTRKVTDIKSAAACAHIQICLALLTKESGTSPLSRKKTAQTSALSKRPCALGH